MRPRFPAASSRSPGDRRGFAIPAVIFLLLFLTFMTASAYQLVRLDALMTRYDVEIGRAEGIGWAALDRFEGESLGVPADTTVYALDGGVAVVSSRRLFRQSRRRWMYVLTASASYADPRSGELQAERVARRYATLQHPVKAVAAFSAVSGQLSVNGGGTVDGNDAAGSSACSAMTGAIGGGMGIGTGGNGHFEGSPRTISASSRDEALGLLDVGPGAWATLMDPGLAMDYDAGDPWPDFTALPADTFPTIRVSGDLAATSAHSGRGLLVVGGTLRLGGSFTWDGIILAGDFAHDTGSPSFTVRGLMVTGFGPLAGTIAVETGADVQYHRCHVTSAGLRLARLEPLPNTSWDAP